MTLDVLNSACPVIDFGPDAHGPFGEAWRWRMGGYAIIATSSVLTCTLYWHVGQYLLSLA
ncbi:hypothetical protein [Rhizobium sp. BK176]|uniref:hypothetical protein n=1 Tax=Rhizobium sp. BK176 TaxID=2587071 RepID=UPI002166CF48|nr:hypothetical protein [Rhizobium sp. BK176]MCS4088754.1 hypothetical protein [Rhizobium sp. BK176]